MCLYEAMAAMAACKNTWRLAVDLFGQLRCQRLNPNVVVTSVFAESIDTSGASFPRS